MTVLFRIATLLFLTKAAFLSESYAQSNEPFTDGFSTKRWCADSGTACWSDPQDRDWFNGVRVLAEFDLGFVFQGGLNRFAGRAKALPKVAFEVNIYKSWIALQIGLFAPGEIILDEESPLRHKLKLDYERTRSLPFDWGYMAGFSFLDSGVALGKGGFIYDRRVFDLPRCSSVQEAMIIATRSEGKLDNETCVTESDRKDSFLYFAFQPVSTLRASIKRVDPIESDLGESGEDQVGFDRD